MPSVVIGIDRSSVGAAVTFKPSDENVVEDYTLAYEYVKDDLTFTATCKR